MNNVKTLNLLKLIRSKYVQVIKTIPLTDKIGDRIFNALAMNNVLSQGRITKLSARVRLSKLFLTFILKYNTDHGATATVKWLKASLVALQKELGQDRMLSTVPLGTSLAYSRLTGGLPRLIPAHQRALIRKGDPREIRFWTGLFNVYRILQIPGQLKLNTITDQFTGDHLTLDMYINLASIHNPFNKINDYKKIISNSLMPTKFYLSRAASPSNKVSAEGVLTDLYLLDKHQPKLLQELMYYLYEVHPHVTPFISALQTGIELIHRVTAYDNKDIIGKDGKIYTQTSHLKFKDSLRNHGGPNPDIGGGLSQFSIKEEAAGKIRLFALIDSITQSVLSPLHDMLFKILRSIPNDGTFDQDASIKRSQEKAIASNCAYSFDLTAATDRLPAKLTAQILATIVDKDIAESWRNIMTDRNFFFNAKVAEKLGISEGPYRYAVGQPMGGLSSWAGLAVTHHWVVQMASFNVTRSLEWNINYEILGDDLVIFDKPLADEYLKIMSDLGCEINLHKSIVSHNRPVFEFAKRTCWGDQIVSGISFAQIRASHSVASRVANAFHYANAGLMSSMNLLASTLSKYVFRHNKSSASVIFSQNKSKTPDITQRLIGLAILSLFGTLHQRGVVTLKEVMTAIVDPSDEEFDYSGNSVGVPVTASLQYITDILRNTGSNVPSVRNLLTFSKQETRDEIFEEYETEFPTIILQSALHKAKALWENQDKYVAAYAQRLIFGPYDKDYSDIDFSNLPYEYREILIHINNFAEYLLGLQDTKWHPEALYDHIYDLAYKHAKSGDRLVKYNEAMDLLDRVEALSFKLNSPEHLAPGKTIIESAPILEMIRGVDYKYMSKKLGYIHDFEFTDNHLSNIKR